MKILQIKPHFRAEIIEPKHVYLLSESSTHALTGELYCQLIPLLNGNYTVDEIINKLQVDPSHIDYALERLQARGYITEAISQLTPEAVAFWGLLKVEPQVAYQCLQQTQVYVSSVANLPTQPLITALEEVGIKAINWDGELQEFPPHSLLVVLTDDYLQPELNKINQIALKGNQPWLLIKPVGTILWLGPIFQPQITGCWECLAQRLRVNREVEASVLRQKNSSLQLSPSQESDSSVLQSNGNKVKSEVIECLPPPPAVIPSTLQTALQLATTEIAKWIVKQGVEDTTPFPTLEGKVITFDQRNLDIQTHILSLRPQCPSCGNPNLLTERAFQPLVLSSRKKQFTSDGGHRAFSPDQTVNRYQHLISPITGVVTSLVRSSDPDDSLLHSYNAIHSFAVASNIGKLRRYLKHKSGGKGKTDRQSKASGFCEAIERYSGVYQGNEPRISATLAELGDKAIHPAKCSLFSSEQYEYREELNRRGGHFDWIPQPFDETKVIEWTPVWSLTEQTHKYIPTAYCYYGYPLPEDHEFCRANSNGDATGNTLEEAILQGFFEIVERDSISIWWYNRLKRPRVDLASFNEPYLLEVQDLYKSKNRDLWVLDVTADLGIPTFVAVSYLKGKAQQTILLGFGTHFDPKIAILRAVTEVNQVGFTCDDAEVNKEFGEMREWFKKATIENQPYLVPDSTVPAKVYQDYQQRWSDDIYQDVMTCVEIAKNAGLETLVLDKTRPDIGLNVVKVIVPEMPHYWLRMGAKRIYDVPVKMGWLSTPLTEEQMNPISVPI
ncbi:TOMM precursor leader peptide-binding protein [Nostoc sp. 2RC]|uniref:TOMM precursor leader peptide-binding protein n=1 Tax=Nostoc sp. 2RC TaxID=2485484 RepID=UPI0016260AF3|nr:TOMM precursor leader peptide-binding protein [Nostoc sp. 2RC]MBC1238192.1 TOMM precursor leader peptide-binding protein [Nostoc sp. 2RC]